MKSLTDDLAPLSAEKLLALSDVARNGPVVVSMARELIEARKALALIHQAITESTMQCNHPTDDNSGDCAHVEDCLFHSLWEWSTMKVQDGGKQGER